MAAATQLPHSTYIAQRYSRGPASTTTARSPSFGDVSTRVAYAYHSILFAPHNVLPTPPQALLHTLFYNDKMVLTHSVANAPHFRKCDVYFSSTTTGNASGCLGRVDCEVDRDSVCVPGKRLSLNASLHNWISRTLGPYGLRVALEGPHVVMAHTRYYVREARGAHSSLCMYSSLFEVGDAGKYLLTVKVDVDGYRGLDDVESTVSSFANRYAIRGLELTCSIHRRNHSPRPYELSRWIWELRPKDKRAELANQFTHPLVGSQWRLVNAKTGEALRSYTYTPKTIDLCMGKVSSLPHKTRVLFTGDSQVRTVYRHYDAVLTQRRASQAKGGNMSNHFDSHTIQFLWDPYLKTLSERLEEYLRAYDVIVFGFGAWPASFGQWSTEYYSAFVTDLLRRIHDHNMMSVGVRCRFPIWVGSPAWPKPRYNVPGFRITNTRLGVWNSISAAAALRYGIGHVDFFEVSWPHIKLHRGDGMHYDHSVVLYGMVDLVIRHICK